MPMNLGKFNLSKKMDKLEFKTLMGRLDLRLGELQRQVRERQIAVALVFEGWGASGKGTLINNLLLALDPRGFNVHLTKSPDEEESLRPFLWRFWIKIPSRGRIAIFDRSWYRRVTVDRVEKNITKSEWHRSYDEIRAFERQLTDGGMVIVKFFLHISKKEQKKRFRRLLGNDTTAWKVSKNDLRQHKEYSAYVKAFDAMIAKTSFSYAPWTVVEAHDHHYATVKVFTAVIASLSDAVKAAEKKTPRAPAVSRKGAVPPILDKIDLSRSMTREEYEQSLKKYQSRLRDIEHEIYIKRIPVLLLYEGWDAAGKGGNIRRLVAGLDPRGYEVVPVAAPNDVEKAHHYLWRFWQNIPKGGHITVFDRSWYGRVLVERVEGFARGNEWKRAYEEINLFERHCADFGMVIVKFWLHIDADEQLRRFKLRKATPYKSWKITDEDWRNRQKWDAYKKAVDEMIYRTSTPCAPWTIVEANCKLYARIKAMKTVIKAVEKRL
jgi:AMP-polyphosphate phosphotransferase